MKNKARTCQISCKTSFEIRNETSDDKNKVEDEIKKLKKEKEESQQKMLTEILDQADDKMKRILIDL